MKHYVLPIVFALALSACAGTTETRALNALAIACDSYATAGDQLVPLRRAGKLSAASIKRVTTANDFVRPVCSRESAIVDPETAIGIVTQGISLLKSVKEGL